MDRRTPTPLETRVSQARRRLFMQLLLNRLGLAWGCALALGLIWFLIEPAAVSGGSGQLKWALLAGLGMFGTVLAVMLARRAAPTHLTAALAIDQRFDLKERVTTAMGLSPQDQSSPAGQALLADANTKLERVGVPGKFPVRIGWRALFLPAQAIAIMLLALYPPPLLTMLAGGSAKQDDEQAKADEKDAQTKVIPPRPFIKPPIERPNKSEELRQLETELEKLYAEHNKEAPEKEKPDQVRERQEKVASAEERLKKREQEMNEKFQKLQDQMSKLTELEQGEARRDGPAKGVEEALAKGDLKKAQEEVDKLQKKAKEKKLDKQEQDQLKKQLDDMDKQVDKLNREQKEKEKKLKDLIDQAKRENRDADALERELQNLQKDQQMTKEMQELAKALKQAKQSLEKNDLDGLSDQLGQIGKQLGDIQDELQDLEDIEEHLQNLKQMKKEGCKECEGEGKKKGEPGSERDNAKGYAEGASGKRPENKDAKTKQGEEERVRGFFDAKGRKQYGGATNGPAFKKSSSVEMAGDIKQAVQEAPEAVEVQRLPKAAKEMVKEYFEKLGNQAPGDKK
ncbi:MAG TPA: hypothetical protein VHR66_25360 [Gemmataceae bacterium]|jgi:hypothetical protein|nr:hypothetical protein [Gemmataceae bacterium]